MRGNGERCMATGYLTWWTSTLVWVEDINDDVEWLVQVYTIVPDYGQLWMVS